MEEKEFEGYVAGVIYNKTKQFQDQNYADQTKLFRCVSLENESSDQTNLKRNHTVNAPLCTLEGKLGSNCVSIL